MVQDKKQMNENELTKFAECEEQRWMVSILINVLKYFKKKGRE